MSHQQEDLEIEDLDDTESCSSTAVWSDKKFLFSHNSQLKENKSKPWTEAYPGESRDTEASNLPVEAKIKKAAKSKTNNKKTKKRRHVRVNSERALEEEQASPQGKIQETGTEVQDSMKKLPATRPRKWHRGGRYKFKSDTLIRLEPVLLKNGRTGYIEDPNWSKEKGKSLAEKMNVQTFREHDESWAISAEEWQRLQEKIKSATDNINLLKAQGKILSTSQDESQITPRTSKNPTQNKSKKQEKRLCKGYKVRPLPVVPPITENADCKNTKKKEESVTKLKEESDRNKQNKTKCKKKRHFQNFRMVYPHPIDSSEDEGGPPEPRPKRKRAKKKSKAKKTPPASDESDFDPGKYYYPEAYRRSSGNFDLSWLNENEEEVIWIPNDLKTTKILRRYKNLYIERQRLLRKMEPRMYKIRDNLKRCSDGIKGFLFEMEGKQMIRRITKEMVTDLAYESVLDEFRRIEEEGGRPPKFKLIYEDDRVEAYERDFEHYPLLPHEEHDLQTSYTYFKEFVEEGITYYMPPRWPPRVRNIIFDFDLRRPGWKKLVRAEWVYFRTNERCPPPPKIKTKVCLKMMKRNVRHVFGIFSSDESSDSETEWESDSGSEWEWDTESDELSDSSVYLLPFPRTKKLKPQLFINCSQGIRSCMQYVKPGKEKKARSGKKISKKNSSDASLKENVKAAKSKQKKARKQAARESKTQLKAEKYQQKLLEKEWKMKRKEAKKRQKEKKSIKKVKTKAKKQEKKEVKKDKRKNDKARRKEKMKVRKTRKKEKKKLEKLAKNELKQQKKKEKEEKKRIEKEEKELGKKKTKEEKRAEQKEKRLRDKREYNEKLSELSKKRRKSWVRSVEREWRRQEKLQQRDQVWYEIHEKKKAKELKRQRRRDELLREMIDAHSRQETKSKLKNSNQKKVRSKNISSAKKEKRNRRSESSTNRFESSLESSEDDTASEGNGNVTSLTSSEREESDENDIKHWKGKMKQRKRKKLEHTRKSKHHLTKRKSKNKDSSFQTATDSDDESDDDSDDDSDDETYNQKKRSFRKDSGRAKASWWKKRPKKQTDKGANNKDSNRKRKFSFKWKGFSKKHRKSKTKQRKDNKRRFHQASAHDSIHESVSESDLLKCEMSSSAHTPHAKSEALIKSLPTYSLANQDTSSDNEVSSTKMDKKSKHMKRALTVIEEPTQDFVDRDLKTFQESKTSDVVSRKAKKSKRLLFPWQQKKKKGPKDKKRPRKEEDASRESMLLDTTEKAKGKRKFSLRWKKKRKPKSKSLSNSSSESRVIRKRLSKEQLKVQESASKSRVNTPSERDTSSKGRNKQKDEVNYIQKGIFSKSTGSKKSKKRRRVSFSLQDEDSDSNSKDAISSEGKEMKRSSSPRECISNAETMHLLKNNYEQNNIENNARGEEYPFHKEDIHENGHSASRKKKKKSLFSFRKKTKKTSKKDINNMSSKTNILKTERDHSNVDSMPSRKKRKFSFSLGKKKQTTVKSQSSRLPAKKQHNSDAQGIHPNVDSRNTTKSSLSSRKKSRRSIKNQPATDGCPIRDGEDVGPIVDQSSSKEKKKHFLSLRRKKKNTAEREVTKVLEKNRQDSGAEDVNSSNNSISFQRKRKFPLSFRKKTKKSSNKNKNRESIKGQEMSNAEDVSSGNDSVSSRKKKKSSSSLRKFSLKVRKTKKSSLSVKEREKTGPQNISNAESVTSSVNMISSRKKKKSTFGLRKFSLSLRKSKKCSSNSKNQAPTERQEISNAEVVQSSDNLISSGKESTSPSGWRKFSRSFGKKKSSNNHKKRKSTDGQDICDAEVMQSQDYLVSSRKKKQSSSIWKKSLLNVKRTKKSSRNAKKQVTTSEQNISDVECVGSVNDSMQSKKKRKSSFGLRKFSLGFGKKRKSCKNDNKQSTTSEENISDAENTNSGIDSMLSKEKKTSSFGGLRKFSLGFGKKRKSCKNDNKQSTTSEENTSDAENTNSGINSMSAKKKRKSSFGLRKFSLGFGKKRKSCKNDNKQSATTEENTSDAENANSGIDSMLSKKKKKSSFGGLRKFSLGFGKKKKLSSNDKNRRSTEGQEICAVEDVHSDDASVSPGKEKKAASGSKKFSLSLGKKRKSCKNDDKQSITSEENTSDAENTNSGIDSMLSKKKKKSSFGGLRKFSLGFEKKKKLSSNDKNRRSTEGQEICTVEDVHSDDASVSPGKEKKASSGSRKFSLGLGKKRKSCKNDNKQSATSEENTSDAENTNSGIDSMLSKKKKTSSFGGLRKFSLGFGKKRKSCKNDNKQSTTSEENTSDAENTNAGINSMSGKKKRKSSFGLRKFSLGFGKKKKLSSHDKNRRSTEGQEICAVEDVHSDDASVSPGKEKKAASGSRKFSLSLGKKRKSCKNDNKQSTTSEENTSDAENTNAGINSMSAKKKRKSSFGGLRKFSLGFGKKKKPSSHDKNRAVTEGRKDSDAKHDQSNSDSLSSRKKQKSFYSWQKVSFGFTKRKKSFGNMMDRKITAKQEISDTEDVDSLDTSSRKKGKSFLNLRMFSLTLRKEKKSAKKSKDQVSRNEPAISNVGNTESSLDSVPLKEKRKFPFLFAKKSKGRAESDVDQVITTNQGKNVQPADNCMQSSGNMMYAFNFGQRMKEHSENALRNLATTLQDPSSSDDESMTALSPLQQAKESTEHDDHLMFDKKQIVPTMPKTTSSGDSFTSPKEESSRLLPFQSLSKEKIHDSDLCKSSGEKVSLSNELATDVSSVSSKEKSAIYPASLAPTKAKKKLPFSFLFKSKKSKTKGKVAKDREGVLSQDTKSRVPKKKWSSFLNFFRREKNPPEAKEANNVASGVRVCEDQVVVKRRKVLKKTRPSKSMIRNMRKSSEKYLSTSSSQESLNTHMRHNHNGQHPRRMEDSSRKLRPKRPRGYIIDSGSSKASDVVESISESSLSANEKDCNRLDTVSSTSIQLFDWSGSSDNINVTSSDTSTRMKSEFHNIFSALNDRPKIEEPSLQLQARARRYSIPDDDVIEWDADGEYDITKRSQQQEQGMDSDL